MEGAFREIRNGHRHLLCEANDCTGEVRTVGPHHSTYLFQIPVGGTFTVIRDNCQSLIKRDATTFAVDREFVVA